MQEFQMTLRDSHTDENSGDKSIITGKSTRNQRIESYWQQFRQHKGDFYINFFKTMEEESLLNVSHPVHIESLRYCFGELIQDDIEITKKEWNTHRVRKQNNRNVEGGILNVLFKCPESVGACDHKKSLDVENIQRLMPFKKIPHLVSTAFNEMANDLLSGFSKPATAKDAYNQYLKLIDAINELESASCDF